MKVFNVNNGEYDYLIAAQTEVEALQQYRTLIITSDDVSIVEILSEMCNNIMVADYEAGDSEHVIMRTVAEMVRGLTEPEILATNEPE